MNSNIKKALISTIIMVITFVVLIMGASYAYFSIGAANNFNTINVSGSASTVGNVALSAGKNLKLNLSAINMMQSTSDQVYYATESGSPSTTLTSLAIATAKVNGNGTMKCEYTLNASVSGTNNMYAAFQNMAGRSTGQLVLVVDGVEYDLYNTTFPTTMSGEISGINSTTSDFIMASFKVVNKSNVKQDSLAGTDLTISFTVAKFECQVIG